MQTLLHLQNQGSIGTIIYLSLIHIFYLSTVDYYDLLFWILYLSKLSTLLLLKHKTLQVNYPFPVSYTHLQWINI